MLDPSTAYKDEFLDADSIRSDKRRERLLAARKVWRTRVASITSSKSEDKIWKSLDEDGRFRFALDKVRDAKSNFIKYGGSTASHLAEMEKALAAIIAARHGVKAEDVLPYADDILPKNARKPSKAPESMHPSSRVDSDTQRAVVSEWDGGKEYFIRQLAGYYMSGASRGKGSNRGGWRSSRKNYPR